MKKVILLVQLAILSAVSFAGSVDNLSQHSADYIRKLSKNGAISGIDIISYNPAGVQQLKKGLYLQLNNQSLIKDYGIKKKDNPLSSKDEFKAETPTLVVPSFYALYKEDKWSAFAAFNIVAGGGELDYKDGVYVLPLLETKYQQIANSSITRFALMNDADFIGSSIYYGGTIGGAYSISKELSLSLAARYIYATRTYEGNGEFTIVDSGIPVEQAKRELDAERTANGINFIFGANYKASEKANFGLRVESGTELEFETDVKTISPQWNALTASEPLNIFKDGAKIRRDLPWVVGFGLDYNVTPELLLSTGVNYYFLEDCEGLDENYENGYELQLATDYQLAKNLYTSIGYNYVKVGGNSDIYYDFEYQLDSHFFATGCKYVINDSMDFMFGAGKVFYISEKSKKENYTDVEYSKDIWLFSFGFEYKLL